MFTILSLMATANNGNNTNLDVIALIVACGGVIFAWLAWWTMRKSFHQQVISVLLMNYRSAEMYHAIKELWKFHDSCKDKELVAEYEKKRQKDDESFSSLPNNERLDAERNSLHYLRRLVSHFYQELGAFYANKIISEKLITRFFDKEDLKIIPHVIVPIENNLRRVLHEIGPLPENHALMKLCELHRKLAEEESSHKGIV